MSTIHSKMGQGITMASVPRSLFELVSEFDVEKCSKICIIIV